MCVRDRLGLTRHSDQYSVLVKSVQIIYPGDLDSLRMTGRWGFRFCFQSSVKSMNSRKMFPISFVSLYPHNREGALASP